MSKIVTPEQAAAELLSRRRALASLHEFTRQAWPQVEGGKPFIDGEHIRAVCEHLEAVYRGDILGLIINLPPRMSKSTVLSVMYPAWCWLQNPGLQFLYASYAMSLSVRDSRKCRQVITSDWYQTRWCSKYHIVSDSDTKQRFDNNLGGYRIATSVDAMATGEGGDFIIVDDGNHTKDISDVLLQNTQDWYSTTMASRVNDFFKSRRIIQQQRTHERDLTGFVLADRDNNYVHLCLPMEFEEKRKSVTVKLPTTNGKRWQDWRKKDGELLCPARIDEEALARLKKEMMRGPGGVYACAGQLQQRPAPEAGGLIKRSYFRLWRDPQPPKIDFTVLSMDTGLTNNETSADSVAITFGVFKDANMVPNVIVLSLWQEKVEYPDLRLRAQRLAKDYLDDGPHERKSLDPKRPDLILIEAKTSGISLVQDLRRGGVPAVGFSPDKFGDKMQRVWLITPLLQAGRLWVPAIPPDFEKPRAWVDPLILQSITFPNAAMRDLVDALSQCFNFLNTWGWVFHPDDPQPVERAPEYEQEGEAAFY